MKLVFATIISFFLLCACTTKKKEAIEKKTPSELKEDKTIREPENNNTTNRIIENNKKDSPKIKKEIVTATKKELSPEKTKIKLEIKKKFPITEKPTKKKSESSTQQKIVENKIEKVIKTKDIEKIEEPVIAKPNHEIWNTLTKKYVSSVGKVNYSVLKKEIVSINNYLLHLEKISPQTSWSRNEKLSYWFNLYNAATVYLITSNYPIQSITNLEGGKPWDKKFIKSGIKTLSLNEIENTIVRPNFNEPRLHVAFNCAAISCPNLLNEAFMPSKLNNQLNRLSKQWINDASKNLIKEDKIQISKIFEWYSVDFKEGIIPFINKYSEQKVNTDAVVSYLEYNWKLNN